MKLPTLIQLAREPAEFVRYQDGKLWYQIKWYDEGDVRHRFDFPIPTCAPALQDAVSEAKDAISIVKSAPYPDIRTLDDVHQLLSKSLLDLELDGAGGGEFLPRDTGLRFLRWIRKHLDFLRESGA